MRRWLVMLLFRINIGEAGNEAYKLGSAFQDLINYNFTFQYFRFRTAVIHRKFGP